MRRFTSLSPSFCLAVYPKADAFEGSSSLFFPNPLWVDGFQEVLATVLLSIWAGSPEHFETG